MERERNGGKTVAERPRDATREMILYIEEFDGGILRRRCGRGFHYIHSTGEKVADRETLRRIRALAIPPAWEQVWISEDARTHIQAFGRDDRGRKQYRYHATWAQTMQMTKFNRMLDFGERLPRIRRRARSDMDLPGLQRRVVLACIVRILDDTGARIGTQQYSLENNTFGISSMLNHHVDVQGSRVVFRYRSKGGIPQKIVAEDRLLARIIRRCQDLPGQRLFEYLDEQGEIQPISSEDVNKYIGEIAEEEFTSKDFRTWKGSVIGLSILDGMSEPRTPTEAKKNVVKAMKQVAAELGNRPATAKKYYVHPAILQAYEHGGLGEFRPDTNGRTEQAPGDLSPPEEHFMALLRLHGAAERVS